MKLIHNFKSPNFNRRKYNKIEFIIIHYTALKNVNESIKFLCNKKNKVSSHYLISQNGEIYNLVSEKYRAWHAGVSYWASKTDINSISIGIELDFSPNYKNNIYGTKLINSLIKLLKKIAKKYKINNHNILGHSDISPYRKIDPGVKFPWHTLKKNNLVFNPKIINFYLVFSLRKWFKLQNIRSKKSIMIFMLAYIGYDISLSINKKSNFNLLLKNYQNHYLQRYSKKNLYKKTYKFIERHFCTLLLTK